MKRFIALALLFAATFAFTQGISYPPASNGLKERDVTGTTSTDTILSTDCANPVVYIGSVAVAVTLPTPTSLGNNICAFGLTNVTSGSSTAVTVTPTTFQVNGASTLTIAQGRSCRFTVNQAGTAWVASCSDLPFVAGTNITLTRGQYGATIAAAAGGVNQSINSNCAGNPSGAGTFGFVGLGISTASGSCAGSGVVWTSGFVTVIPVACTLKNLWYAETNGAGHDASDQAVTVWTASSETGSLAASTLTCTAGVAQHCSDVTHTVALTAGSVISVKNVIDGTGAGVFSVAMQCQ